MKHTLAGAHIFRAGTWNKQTFTEEDLDGIVAAFNAANKAGRVPLKFGHADDEADQPFREGLPALGWVSKVWRAGKDLFADFIDMPTAVFQAVKNGLYKFVSIELLKNAEYEGNRFPYLLDAVALLGADPPAVDGLQDLQKLALSRASFKFAEVLTFTAKLPKHTHLTGDLNDMDPNELKAAIAAALGVQLAPLQAKLDEAVSDVSKFKADNIKLKADLDAAIAKNKAQEDAAKVEKIKHARDGVTEVLEAGVRLRKITPAQRENFAKILKVADDSAVLEINIADVEALAGVSAKDAKTTIADGKSAFSKQKTGDQGGSESVSENGADDHAVVLEVFTKAQAMAEKRGLNVFQVLPDVVRQDPKLGQRVLQYLVEDAA
jgi:hypothetical protein